MRDFVIQSYYSDEELSFGFGNVLSNQSKRQKSVTNANVVFITIDANMLNRDITNIRISIPVGFSQSLFIFLIGLSMKKYAQERIITTIR